MAKRLGSLYLDLVANTAKFKEGLANATKNVDTWRKKNRKSLKAVSEAFKVTAAAAAALGGAVTLLTKKGLENVDALAKMSRALGTTPQDLKALQFAGQLAGASVEELNKSLLTLQKNVGDFAMGTGEAKTVLEGLGVTADDLVDLPISEQFGKVADEINKLGTETERNAARTKIFGESWVAVGDLLIGGSETIDEMRKRFDRLGFSFNVLDTSAVEDANDAMTELKTILGFVGDELAIRLAPYIQAVTEYLTDSAIAAGGFGDVVQSVTDKMVAGFGFVLDVLHGIRVLLKAGQLAVSGLIVLQLKQIQLWINAINLLLKAWENLINFIIKGVEKALNTALPFIENIINGMIQAAEGLVNAVVGTIEFIINNAIKGINLLLQPVTKAINALIEAYNRLPGTDDIEKVRLELAKEVKLGRAEFEGFDLPENIELPTVEAPQIPTDTIDEWVGYAVEAAKDTAAELGELTSGLTPSQELQRRVSESKLDKQAKDANLSINNLQEGVEGVNESTDLLAESGKSLTNAMSGLGDSIADVVTGTTSLEDAGRSFLQTFATDTLKGLTESLSQQLSSVIKNIVSGASGSGGWIQTGISAIASYFSGGFAGGAAMGGGVNAGARYLVGERGPEMFVPAASGRIVPNDQMGGTFYVDNRGASVEAVQRLEQLIIQLNGSIEQRAISAVQDGMARSPSFLRR